MYNLISIKLN